jgi:hypothetical protein
MTDTIHAPQGLEALRSCRRDLQAARADAIAATGWLAGTRVLRAMELVDQLHKSIAHCERLAVVVEGDLRAEG